MSPQFFRVILSNLDDLICVRVWMISIFPQFFSFPSLSSRFLGIIQRAPTMTGITVTFMFHSFIQFSGKVQVFLVFFFSSILIQFLFLQFPYLPLSTLNYFLLQFFSFSSFLCIYLFYFIFVFLLLNTLFLLIFSLYSYFSPTSLSLSLSLLLICSLVFVPSIPQPSNTLPLPLLLLPLI